MYHRNTRKIFEIFGQIRESQAGQQNFAAPASSPSFTTTNHRAASLPTCTWTGLPVKSSIQLRSSSLDFLLIYNDVAFGSYRQMGCQVIMRWLFTCSKESSVLTFLILRLLGPVPHDISYYSKCMLGGVLACGITHAGITPLDVAKCNMQVSHLR